VIERAILQQVIRRDDGATTVEAYQRPAEVRSRAQQVKRWAVKEFDPCDICKNEAVILRSGVAYCAKHRDELRYDIDPRPGRLSAMHLRAEPSPRELQGVAVVFNAWSVDLGGFRERIRPHAVDRT